MSEEVMQKTDEWFALRCGKFTGSRFEDVTAVSKKDGKPLKAREDLVWEILSERIQGYQPQGASAYSLKWGTDNEPLACEAYEFRTGNFVEKVAFIQSGKYDFVGVSPDGLVGDDGMIEIKCPSSPREHIQRFKLGVPEKYIPQIQGCLWVTGRKWCDFVSYDPDTAEAYRLLVIRVYRDEAYIEKLEKEVLSANAEVEALAKEIEEARLKLIEEKK